jgi:hypothetical protein
MSTSSVGPGFQVEYEIKPSSLGPEVGLGIFSKQFIRSGQLIWKYSRGQNVASYSNQTEVEARLEQLNKEEKEFFVSHIYLYDGKVNEILDDAKFWNHVSLILTEFKPNILDITLTLFLLLFHSQSLHH